MVLNRDASLIAGSLIQSTHLALNRRRRRGKYSTGAISGRYLGPANLETTAQGAADLAGIASGLWSIDELNA